MNTGMATGHRPLSVLQHCFVIFLFGNLSSRFREGFLLLRLYTFFSEAIYEPMGIKPASICRGAILTYIWGRVIAWPTFSYLPLFIYLRRLDECQCEMWRVRCEGSNTAIKFTLIDQNSRVVAQHPQILTTPLATFKCSHG